MGPSYRSAIYYTNPAQKEIAQQLINEMNASDIWPGDVVTEITAASDFWLAEPEHQDYLLKYPNGYTCHGLRPTWILPQDRSSAIWM